MEHIYIPINNQKIKGTLFFPETVKEKNPGVLFIHGFSTGESRYVGRAKALASVGAICLTISLRGHEQSDGELKDFSRSDHLEDVLAAYDFLISQKGVDTNAIGVSGASYGGYLASILSSKRNIKWLALREPALYKNENFSVPTVTLVNKNPDVFKQHDLLKEKNFALEALLNFLGEVLLIESEIHDIIPHKTIETYQTALKNKKYTYKLMKKADHSLSSIESKQEYIDILKDWFQHVVHSR